MKTTSVTVLILFLTDEDVHDEVITYSQQTLNYPPPQLTAIDESSVVGAADNRAQLQSREVFIPSGSTLDVGGDA